MTRIGINPARGKTTAYRPSRVTVTMLTYVPNLAGYFRAKLDVVKLALTSMAAHTPADCDILVFDNGSCPELVDFLRGMRDAGKIKYLLLSADNIGKIAALRIMYQTAPGELIAYADDDILFYPGWLEAHLEVLGAFPKTGMVSGVAVRNANTYARIALDDLIARGGDGADITLGRFIPDAWETDWAHSTGRDPEEHLRQQADLQDVRLASGGVEAIGGANHFQYLAPKELILRCFPEEWSGMLMGQMRDIDHKLDTLRFLRLATFQRYTRHLGNTLTAEMADTARSLGLEIAEHHPAPVQKKHWILAIPGAGRILRWLYDRLFHIIHEIE